MKLYFSPLACSLATRIVLYEAGAAATFERVDLRTKLDSSGRDFRRVHPLGLVPTLELANGTFLRENAAVLQHVARAYPEARLAPTEPASLAELQQWLSFIGSELHKALFIPLLDAQAPTPVKAYALDKADGRLGWLADELRDREFLLARFSVADAYLFTVLNWSTAAPVDLSRWPALASYQARLGQRPSIARALGEERAMYRAEPAARAPEAEQAGLLSTAEVIERFNSAFLRHEPALLDDLVADDCVLENSGPAPLGSRHVGREACTAFWRGIAENTAAHFELEDVELTGERAQIRWRYVWGAGEADCVRGVNLMRVRHGRIVEGRGYVKGP